MLGNWKVLAIISVMSVAYFGYSQFRINSLIERNSFLEISVSQQRKLLDQKTKDLTRANNIRKDLSKKFDEARSVVQSLEAKLNKRDLGKVAARKPKLVERRVNKATKDVFKCFEQVSASEKNSNCSSLTN